MHFLPLSIMCTLYCESEETLNTEGRTYIVSLYILCGVVVILDDCTQTMVRIVNLCVQMWVLFRIVQ